MMRSLWVCSLCLCLSCGVALQPSVRSSSVDCSTSYGYAFVDLALAGGLLYGASRGWNTSPEPAFVQPTEITAGVMAASGLIGLYKRHNCARWRETAPPEEWARVAEIDRRNAEAAAEAERIAQAQAAEAAQQQQQLEQQQLEQQQLLEQQQQEQAGGQPQSGPNIQVQQRTTVNSSTVNNTHVNVVQRNVAPPPPAVSNPAYRAHFQSNAGAPMQCQAFSGDPYGRAGDNMAACIRWCTPYMAAKLRCQCDAGGC